MRPRGSRARGRGLVARAGLVAAGIVCGAVPHAQQVPAASTADELAGIRVALDLACASVEDRVTEILRTLDRQTLAGEVLERFGIDGEGLESVLRLQSGLLQRGLPPATESDTQALLDEAEKRAALLIEPEAVPPVMQWMRARHMAVRGSVVDLTRFVTDAADSTMQLGTRTAALTIHAHQDLVAALGPSAAAEKEEEALVLRAEALSRYLADRLDRFRVQIDRDAWLAEARQRFAFTDAETASMREILGRLDEAAPVTQPSLDSGPALMECDREVAELLGVGRARDATAWVRERHARGRGAVLELEVASQDLRKQWEEIGARGTKGAPADSGPADAVRRSLVLRRSAERIALEASERIERALERLEPVAPDLHRTLLASHRATRAQFVGFLKRAQWSHDDTLEKLDRAVAMREASRADALASLERALVAFEAARSNPAREWERDVRRLVADSSRSLVGLAESKDQVLKARIAAVRAVWLEARPLDRARGLADRERARMRTDREKEREELERTAAAIDRLRTRLDALTPAGRGR